MRTKIRSLPLKLMITFKKKSDIHWERKIWHMIGVFGLFIIYQYFQSSVAQWIFFTLWLLFAGGDLLRLRIPAFNQKVLRYFYPVMRDQEETKLAGTSYLLSGVLLVILFFPRNAVSLTLLFLAFGDPLASYFGLKWGKHRILGNKTLEGTAAAFGVCWLLTELYLYQHPLLFSNNNLSFPMLAALIGAFSEMIPIGDLDDNFTLPLISAICLSGLLMLFQ